MRDSRPLLSRPCPLRCRVDFSVVTEVLEQSALSFSTESQPSKSIRKKNENQLTPKQTVTATNGR